MLLVALLVEPACLLYTRGVMQAAAAQTARVLATRVEGAGGTEEACRRFCLRRLEAVPEVSLFHVGGAEDWQVSLTGAEGSSQVSVEISGHARPLPVLGVVAGAFGESDGEGVVLRVRVSERVRPEWLEGGYGDWVDMWD
jgi:hypothetical protein